MHTPWRDFHTDVPDNTVVGTLLYQTDVYSPQLDNHRTIYVWLPPSYAETEKAYPVLYMHDGQNLFDEGLSANGEWGVDEALTELAAEGIEVIVVGIPNIGGTRANEYSPYENKRWGDGYADTYLEFLVHIVKPMIDGDFRTKSQPVNTGTMGSSMGGLVSLYAGFATDVFGKIGAVSPFFVPFPEKIAGMVHTAPPRNVKIYMDVGTDEARNMDLGIDKKILSRQYLETVRYMRDVLIQKGYDSDASLMYVEDLDAIHHETAWRKRLPDALRFLFGSQN